MSSWRWAIARSSADTGSLGDRVSGWLAAALEYQADRCVEESSPVPSRVGPHGLEEHAPVTFESCTHIEGPFFHRTNEVVLWQPMLNAVRSARPC